MLSLPKGSSVCTTVVVSHDSKVAQQWIQEDLDQKRACEVSIASNDGTSFLSPQPNGKKLKRKYSSKAEAKEKPRFTEEILEGMAKMVLDEIKPRT